MCSSVNTIGSTQCEARLGSRCVRSALAPKMNTGKRQERARVNDERFVTEENHERIVNVTAVEYQRRLEHYPS